MVCGKAVKSEAGWSLAEVIVCVGLMVILGTAALPRAVSLDKMYVKYETLHLLNGIRYVQVWSHSHDYCAYDNHKLGPRLWPSVYINTKYNYYSLQESTHHCYVRYPEHGVKITPNTREKIIFHGTGDITACTIRVHKGDYEERIIIDTVGRTRVEEG